VSHDGGVALDWRYQGWETSMVWAGWSRLRSARFWAGMSQEELADAVGTTRETISSLERGRSTPSVTLACALAHELSLTVEELFAADELR